MVRVKAEIRVSVKRKLPLFKVIQGCRPPKRKATTVYKVDKYAAAISKTAKILWNRVSATKILCKYVSATNSSQCVAFCRDFNGLFSAIFIFFLL